MRASVCKRETQTQVVVLNKLGERESEFIMVKFQCCIYYLEVFAVLCHVQCYKWRGGHRRPMSSSLLPAGWCLLDEVSCVQ
eukprot:1853061-Amphidinium_carterae.1